MARHKFAVGQVVDLLYDPRNANVPRGRYKIQRLFPTDSGPPQYRVKHMEDGHERVITETQVAQPLWSTT